MFRERCIDINNQQDWREALQGIRHSFFHTWENCYAMYLSTGFKTYLYYCEGDNFKVVCPISERIFENYIDIVTPYGFSGFTGDGNFDQFPKFWNNFVEQKNYICGYIGLNPIFDSEFSFNLNEYRQYNNIYIIDLTLSYEQLFTNLSNNRKRQVKNWQENIFKYNKKELIYFFIENYYDFMMRKNSAGVYNFSQETLRFLLGLDNVFMVGAGKPDKVEAVSVFAYSSYVGDFLFNVSVPDGQHHSVPLLWYAVNYLKSLQIPLFNLGGGVRENDSLAEFKERFGANKLPLRCLKQVYQPEIYEKLCAGVNANPKDMTGYFPAYRKPGKI